jgi:U32 family peptidase
MIHPMQPFKPEVLAPAGNPEALQAAIGSGADAVYFGLTDYNARIRARNFELGDLPDILRDLRRWGVKSYLTFNTLVFSEEMRAARDALEAIALAGPDAIIVQDLGVLRLTRQIAPGMPIHASTQMTISSADGLRLVQRLGVQRAILARELTLSEIAQIRHESTLALEVFVHGALCVSYSGQCLSSEAWGGRSANRGQCAQACRLPYDLMVDSRRHDLRDRVYLLSPKDLEGYQRVEELTALGISGFKIEGRMKSPQYVAASTSLYRAAVDRAWDRLHGGCDPADRLLERRASDSRQVFSRGSCEGFLGGVNHQMLVDGKTRSHCGLPVGQVARVEHDRDGRPFALVVQTRVPERGETPVEVHSGDGLLLRISAREEDEVGGRVLSAETGLSPRQILIRFARAAMPDLSRVIPGTPVYRTNDPALDKRLQRQITSPRIGRQVPLSLSVRGRVGQALAVTCTDPSGRTVSMISKELLQQAHKTPLDEPLLREHLGRLGQTRYRLDVVSIDLEDDGVGLFLPLSELNHLRRALVEEMETLRGLADPSDAAPAALPAAPAPPSSGPASETISPVIWAVDRAECIEVDLARPAGFELPEDATQPSPVDGPFEDHVLVLCRDREQVRGALDARVKRIVLDFLDLVGLKETAAELYNAGVRRTLALPRVQKPGEERIESFLLRQQPEEILVRSLGGLERLRALREERAGSSDFPLLVGDVSLNAVNPESFVVLHQQGLSRVTPGLDLDLRQLELLIEQIDPGRCEIPLHHHLPVFHTEHCVFAAFLSDGADFRTCGRPCDRHRLELRDRTGQAHAVVADVGCRNTVFAARPQSAVTHLASLRRAGVGHFRCELISQDRAQTMRTIQTYREVWDAGLAPEEAVARLKAQERYGVSTGSTERPRSAPLKPVGGRVKPAGRPTARPGTGPATRPPAKGTERRPSTPTPAPRAPLRSGRGSGPARGKGSGGSRGSTPRGSGRNARGSSGR